PKTHYPHSREPPPFAPHPPAPHRPCDHSMPEFDARTPVLDDTELLRLSSRCRRPPAKYDRGILIPIFGAPSFVLFVRTGEHVRERDAADARPPCARAQQPAPILGLPRGLRRLGTSPAAAGRQGEVQLRQAESVGADRLVTGQLLLPGGQPVP